MATYISGPGGELYHWKYVKREKIGDKKYRYWYPEDLKRAAVNAASSVATAAGNAINTGINKVKSITPEDVQRKRAEIETAAKKVWGVDAKKALDSAETRVKNNARREQDARTDWAAARSDHRKALMDVEKSRAERKKNLESGEYDPHTRLQKLSYAERKEVKNPKTGRLMVEYDRKQMKTDKEYMQEDAARLRPSREAEAKAKSNLDKRTAQTNTAKEAYKKALKTYNRTPMAIVAKSKDALKAGVAATSKYGSKKLSDIKRAATKIRDDRKLKKAVRRTTEQDQAEKQIKKMQREREKQFPSAYEQISEVYDAWKKMKNKR